MEDEIIKVVTVPLLSGKLQGIVAHADGSKTIIYDGIECAPSAVTLTALEQEEVESVVYVEPAPKPVPKSVTMRQARLALLIAGKLGDAVTLIAGLPSPQKEMAQIEWEYSQTVERGRPFVALLGAALGLDDAALDSLFIHAETL